MILAGREFDPLLLGRGAASFFRALDFLVPRELLPRVAGRPFQILDLACGSCEEALALQCFVAGEDLGVTVTDTLLWGIDVRDRKIEEALARTRALQKFLPERELSQQFDFVCGDASNLDNFCDRPADIVVLRHQNVWHDRAIWTRIFAQALERISPNGVILLTSYFDREHAIALQLFRELGARVEFNARNPFSQPLSEPGKSTDRHISLLRVSSSPTVRRLHRI